MCSDPSVCGLKAAEFFTPQERIVDTILVLLQICIGTDMVDAQWESSSSS